MKRLKVGVLDLNTNTPNEAWFYSRIMAPGFSSIMPQAVAAWAEELGHEVLYDTYTGREDLSSCFPKDLDVLFVACFSRASYLAYGISEFYRKKGVITVLGGPHARSFPSHAIQYFDYVCGLTDKPLIQSILQAPARHSPGQHLEAAGQPRELPGVRQRSRFIKHALDKGSAVFRAVPVIGSLGCPYSCVFCVDAPIPYRPMPYEGIVDDLKFTQEFFGKNTLIGWHDPNFGVRFKDYINVIEESATQLVHIAESSLSLLSEENLKSLKRVGFGAMLPGIESWYDFNAKGGSKKLQGREKVEHVADHMNLIQSYIPYVQTNFVLGLDSDIGDEPWELTREFLRRTPTVFPAFSIVTDFKNSPLSKQLRQEGRTTHVPYALLDNNFAFNVKLKNYNPIEFYDRMISLQDDTYSYGSIAKRFWVNRRPTVKALNLGRGLTEGRGRNVHHREVRRRLAEDKEFLGFTMGDQLYPPQFFFDAIRAQLGQYADWVPQELLTPRGFVESEQRAALAVAA